jgi:hypothetical protein
MAKPICVKVVWDNQVYPQPLDRRFNILHVNPSDEFPFGRKGLVFANAWKQLNSGPSKGDGLLIMDADVMIDPEDFNAMMMAIEAEPGIVHVAEAKIFPKSTKRASWSWAHWVTEPSQVSDPEPLWFSFNFTWLPKALIEACVKEGMKIWTYPQVDVNVARTAQKTGIKAKVVPGCHPKHMNF